MPLKLITRTPIPDVNLELDERTYRDVWPRLRLKEATVYRPAAHSGGSAKLRHEIVSISFPPAGEINLAIVDSGTPDGELGGPSKLPARALAAGRAVNNRQDRDEDGHASDLAATIRGSDAHLAPNLRFFKPFGAQGWPTPGGGAKEIERAAQGARVIVLAWDAGHTTAELRQKILAMRNTAVVVIAAGNWSLDIDRHPNWPACYGREMEMDHVITVMATDEHDERASYSNYGAESVYIAAPGLAVLRSAPSSSPLRRYGSLRDSDRRFRGTSVATAHVARLAALVQAKYPEMKPWDIKRHIGATARKVGSLRKFRVTGVEKLCVTEAIVDFEKALA